MNLGGTLFKTVPLFDMSFGAWTHVPGPRNMTGVGKQLTNKRMLLRLLIMTKPKVYPKLYGNHIENY